MASSVYLGLLKIVSGYVNETKAREVMHARWRSLAQHRKRWTRKPSRKSLTWWQAQQGLYVAAATRRSDLAKKIAVLAGMEKHSPL
jgi:hypothetical protein